MLLVARIIQYCLCSVSMVLTALFAISLVGVEFNRISQTEFSIEFTLTLALFILIGICIDLGKYLFWINRFRARYYVLMSIVLTMFSLIASFAFFVAAEYSAVEKISSTYYFGSIQNTNVEAIANEINQLEKLVENRLASRFHEQWKEAENNTKRIRELSSEMNSIQNNILVESEERAQDKLVITRFFKSVGKIANVDPGSVRNTFYITLGLLLEFSSLIMISLNTELNKDKEQCESRVQKKNGKQTRKKINRITDSIKKRLFNDIESGEIDPVIRKIRSAGYGLSIEAIKEVLRDLHRQRIIRKDKRNSFKMSE